jgi:lysophospholipase L1-like esterase
MRRPFSSPSAAADGVIMRGRRQRVLRAALLTAGVAAVLAVFAAQIEPGVPFAAGTPEPVESATPATPGSSWLVTGPPPITSAPVTTSVPPATGPATSPAAGDRRPLRIMPLGDSITFGSGSSTRSSYRVGLHRRLSAAGLSVDFVGSVRSGAGADVDNEGHPGWRIAEIAARADEWLAASRPDVVLLHIGTNDMRSDERAVGAAGRLSALIDQILAARPGVRIFVAELVGARDEAVQARIDAYNAEIPGIVAGKGPRVRLVDLSSVDGPGLADNLHPNDDGSARMAVLWYRAVLPVLARLA